MEAEGRKSVSAGGRGGVERDDGERLQRAATDAVKLAPPPHHPTNEDAGRHARISNGHTGRRRARSRHVRQMASPSESVVLISVKWQETPQPIRSSRACFRGTRWLKHSPVPAAFPWERRGPLTPTRKVGEEKRCGFIPRRSHPQSSSQSHLTAHHTHTHRFPANFLDVLKSGCPF